MSRTVYASAVLLLGMALNAPIQGEALTSGMERGKVELQSAGPATFAPQGILLVGDTAAASIYAIATEEKPGREKKEIRVDNIDQKIAGMLGTKTEEILINDLAVNPETGTTYLTVSRGKGPDAQPIIVKIDASGSLDVLPLDDVLFAKTAIPSAPQGKQRQDVTTDLQFTGGRVLVAGLSNEEFASQLRSIPFPFGGSSEATSVEIFHGAHGRYETKSPIRTFALLEIQGEPTVLAAYTCTPLVKFPVKELQSNTKVKGKTVAELGNRNRPLDMVVYEKDGKEYILMANTARGLMKVDLSGIASAEEITEKIPDKAGLPYETIEDAGTVVQLDRLDDEHAILLVQADRGFSLKSIELP